MAHMEKMPGLTLNVHLQKISAYDGMPQSYCTNCMNTIETCSSFRRLCAISAQQLQTILKDRIRKEKSTSTMEPEVPETFHSGQTVMQLEIEQLDDAAYSIDYIDTKYGTEEDCYGDFEILSNSHSVEYAQLPDGLVDQYENVIVKAHDDTEHLNVVSYEDEIGVDAYYSISDTENFNEDASVQIKDEPNDPVDVDIDDTGSMGEEDVEPEQTEAEILTEQQPSKKGRRKNGEKELCPDCGGLFISLKNHMQTHRDKNRRKCYTCDQCEAKFVNKASYIGHVNKHNNVTPFQCPQCPRSFHGKGNLRMHMNSHSTVNRYACTECDKAFRYSHMLALHRRSHTLERVYFCEFCSYCSVNRENYKNHLMNHTGVYRFNCAKCLKGFKKRIYYMKHMKTHELAAANT